MTAVMFHHRQEFLDELANDKELVARNVVRVTPQQRVSKSGSSLWLIASASIGDDVVSLHVYIGERWGIKPSDSDVVQKLEAERESLEQELYARGFELRAGEFTEQAVATR
jgi:hypothetical protein